MAGDIPEAIEIDITNLMLNEAIRLSEITLPEGAEIPGFDEENDQMIVSVNPPRAEEEEPEILAEGEEGDVSEGDEASEDQDDANDETPEEMVEQIIPYLEDEMVNIIGGCCGLSPNHIKEIAQLK